MAVAKDLDLFSEAEWARTREELGLSARQAQIVKLVLEGHSDKSIAQTLDISLATVRTHMRRLFDKFDLGDRLELTLLVLASLRGRVGAPPTDPTEQLDPAGAAEDRLAQSDPHGENRQGHS